jgi:mRNA interferase MazF
LRRGQLYRVRKPGTRDPRRTRVFVVVSRQVLIDSKFSTVVCAPVYSSHHGLTTQLAAGPEVGLKHASSILCDELISLPKALLSDYVGSLPAEAIPALDRALVVALGVDTASL